MRDQINSFKRELKYGKIEDCAKREKNNKGAAVAISTFSIASYLCGKYNRLLNPIMAPPSLKAL